jgi:hypothetical protein
MVNDVYIYIYIYDLKPPSSGSKSQLVNEPCDECPRFLIVRFVVMHGLEEK